MCELLFHPIDVIPLSHWIFGQSSLVSTINASHESQLSGRRLGHPAPPVGL